MQRRQDSFPSWRASSSKATVSKTPVTIRASIGAASTPAIRSGQSLLPLPSQGSNHAARPTSTTTHQQAAAAPAQRTQKSPALDQARQRLQRRLLPAEQAADALGQAPSPSAAPLPFARWLTRRIKACSTWQELQRVWHDYYSYTNAVHITAAASRLANLAAASAAEAAALQQARHLHSGDTSTDHDLELEEDSPCCVHADGTGSACDRPELSKFATSLICCAADRLSELDARGVANLLHAHAALQRAVPHSSRAAAGALGALSLAAAALAREMRPQEVSNTLWALGTLRLGARLPGWWFEVFEEATAEAAAGMEPREAAGALWAMARLRRVPGGTWVEAAVRRRRVKRGGPRELCTLLWGLSVVAGVQREEGGSGGVGGRGVAGAAETEGWLDSEWLGPYVERLEKVLPSASIAQVTQAWLALSRLPLPLSDALLASLLAQTADLLHKARPQAVFAILHSIARLRLTPGPEWWGQMLPHLSVALRAAEPQGIAMAAWALGKLQARAVVGSGVMEQLVSCSGRVLQQQVSCVCGSSGSSSSGRRGGEGSSSGLEAGAVMVSSGFSAPELAALAWGLGRLSAKVPQQWVEAFCRVCGTMLDHFTAGELSMVLVGLGGMQRSSSGVTCSSSSRSSSACGVRESSSGSSDRIGSSAGVSGSSSSSSSNDGVGSSASDDESTSSSSSFSRDDSSSSTAWGRAVLDASRSVMVGAPVKELTALLVGCARLELVPDGKWMAAFEDALMPHIAWGPQRHRRLPPMLSATQQQQQQQQLQHVKREESCESSSRASQVAAAEQLQPQEAALLLWSLARLQLRPSPALSRALLPAAAARAHQMGSFDAAMVLWSLARLWGCRSQRRRVDASDDAEQGLDHSARAPARFESDQKRRLPDGVGGLVVAVLEGQRRLLLRRLKHIEVHGSGSMGSHRDQLANSSNSSSSSSSHLLADARNMALMLRSLARLGHKPEASWLDAAWMGSLAPALPHLSAHAAGSLTAVVRSLADLGASPSATTEWLGQLADATAPALAHWEPQPVAWLVRDLSRVDGAWIGSEWLRAACGALDAAALRQLSVVELASVLTGLTRLGFAPPGAWVGAALEELRHRQEAGACGDDEVCEVWQQQALQMAAAMYAFGRG